MSTVDEKLDKVLENQGAHGEALARLEERTEQHEKRMDRTDRRAVAGGAATGGIVSAVVVALKALATKAGDA